MKGEGRVDPREALALGTLYWVSPWACSLAASWKPQPTPLRAHGLPPAELLPAAAFSVTGTE